MARSDGLRLKLIGKPLVGFDTTRWASDRDAAATKSRVGNKPNGGGGEGGSTDRTRSNPR